MPPLEPYVVSCRAGKFDRTNRADLTSAVDAYLAAPDATALVAHFHGGLVPEITGLAIAARLAKTYGDAGASPVFFVWEAGLIETLRDSLPEIAGERIFQNLVRKILDAALKHAGLGDARGDGKEDPEIAAGARRLGTEEGVDRLHRLDAQATQPVDRNDEAEFRAQLEADDEFNAAADAAVAFLRADAGVELTRDGGPPPGTVPQPTLMSPAFADDGTSTRGLVSTAKLIASAINVLKRVVERSLKGRDHGTYCTVVEEILREFYLAAVGTFVWGQMKAHTGAAFGAGGEVYAGTAFLEEVARSGGKRFVLVGHSTGAIWICDLLDRAAEIAPDATFELYLLAPACTFKRFADALAKHEKRIARVRVFGMKDEVEAQDKMVPVLYPRSLLYFVSGILEGEPDTPLLGMARYFEDREPYRSLPEVQRVKAYFERHAGWSVLSLTDEAALDGLRSASRAHGDFDDDGPTLASLQHLIRKGAAAWPA